MLKTYNRQNSIEYAKIWAKKRNPIFFNFDSLGGDCTNYVSQCIFAGSKVMNYDTTNGWYYISPSSRSASWTSTEFLYKFLTTNTKNGPFGKNIPIEQASIGDIIQFGDEAKFYHSAIVVSTKDDIYLAAHTKDSYMRKLSSYNHPKTRCIHIEAIRLT